MKDDTRNPAPASRKFPYHLALRATLRDTDGVGHVNNAVYLTWTEEARTAYALERCGLSSLSELDFILAAAQLDYRSPVELNEIVDLWCGPSRVGARSWEMRYEGRARGDGRLVFEARTVQVHYDYRERRSAPISAPWRRILEEDLIR